MNNSNEIIKKPHLTNKERYPRIYKEVEKILKTVKKCEANAKTVLHNAKLARNIFNRVYALTFNVLKQSHLLNAVIEEVELFKKEPYLRKELAEILLHEMIFGKGLPGDSVPVQIVRKYELEIKTAYYKLVEKGISATSDINSIPKYVRINTLVTTIPEVLEDLEYLGVEQVLFDDSTSDSDYLELVKNLQKKTFLVDKHFKNLLVFHPDENLTGWPLYQKGCVLIQDKSSFIPPYVLNPEPGSVVLDACAAPGMKTLHLASMMENKGTLYAFERDEKRFKILNNMLQSGHTDIYKTFCEDFSSVDVSDEKFSSVEYILLDPSCSGSGMVNRMDSVTDTGESKTDARIQKLAGFQIVLLKHALLFPSVKRVVYSTCSVTEQENEFVVHEALAHFTHKFKLTPVLPDWPIRGSEEYEFGPLCLRAYPDKSLTNGFFVAMFERIDTFESDNNYLFGKRIKKFKKEKFVEDANVSGYEQKGLNDSQNDWENYGNEQNENSLNHLVGDVDSNRDNVSYSIDQYHNLENPNNHEDCEPEVSPKHKKSKKHKRNTNESDSINHCHSLENPISNHEQSEPEAPPKHKKSKKHKKDRNESALIDQYHNMEDATNNHEHSEPEASSKHKKSKKHKRDRDESESIDQYHNLENPINHEQCEPEASPKHKKSKKHKRDRDESDSINQYHNLENPADNNDQCEPEAPKHKKSKKHKRDRKEPE